LAAATWKAFVIYLVHHAAALDADVDPERPLSPEGRAHATSLAVDAAGRGVRPDVIWHSGKLRARQTADAFRSACNPLAEFSAIRGLQPTDPPTWIRDRVTGDERTLMLVGHFPSLPRILHVLVTGSMDGGSGDFPLHGVVALEPRDGLWVVTWEAGRI
jgi:phosphohistidine phosphatase